MTLIDFLSHFPDEESCKQKFKAYRDQVGVVCSKCGGTDHYWKKDKEQYECKHCKTRTTLKSGTVMHKSKLPFRYWFIAMHLLTSTKKTFSAKEIQRQLGNRYQSKKLALSCRATAKFMSSPIWSSKAHLSLAVLPWL